MGHPLRSYGRPPMKPLGTPIASPLNRPMRCPNCGCTQVMSILVKAEKPDHLEGDEGASYVGSYLGCPACPWASPAVVMKEVDTGVRE